MSPDSPKNEPFWFKYTQVILGLVSSFVVGLICSLLGAVLYSFLWLTSGIARRIAGRSWESWHYEFMNNALVVAFGVAVLLTAFSLLDRAKQSSRTEHRKSFYQAIKDSSCSPLWHTTKAAEVWTEGRDRSQRKLVVIIDGTNDFAADVPTNPYRLAQLLQGQSNVCVYYDGGVGSLRKDGRNSVSAQLGGLLDMAFGISLARNVRDAYGFLVENYQESDELMFFGFSRGAFACRVLIGILFVYGLVEKHQKNLIPFIWQRACSPKLNVSLPYVKAFRRGINPRVKIPIGYVGLWDTVDAVGFLRQQTFPFSLMLPNVLRIRHAIALDEARNMFSEVPIGVGDEPGGVREEQWFPGVHRDVGGGAKETRWLASLAFDWVVAPAFPDLVRHNRQEKRSLQADGILNSRWITFGYGILGLLPLRKFSSKWSPQAYRWHYFKFKNIRKPRLDAVASASLRHRWKECSSYHQVGEFSKDSSQQPPVSWV